MIPGLTPALSSREAKESKGFTRREIADTPFSARFFPL
jgi:hypothetical protein